MCRKDERLVRFVEESVQTLIEGDRTIVNGYLISVFKIRAADAIEEKRITCQKYVALEIERHTPRCVTGCTDYIDLDCADSDLLSVLKPRCFCETASVLGMQIVRYIMGSEVAGTGDVIGVGMRFEYGTQHRFVLVQ